MFTVGSMFVHLHVSSLKSCTLSSSMDFGILGLHRMFEGKFCTVSLDTNLTVHAVCAGLRGD
jgi:NCAIR mutase (PurE)-related protein